MLLIIIIINANEQEIILVILQRLHIILLPDPVDRALRIFILL